MAYNPQQYRPIEPYGGKYVIDQTGNVFRASAEGRLSRLSQSGNPRRVRLYWQGHESRPYVHTLLLETWGREGVYLAEVCGAEKAREIQMEIANG